MNPDGNTLSTISTVFGVNSFEIEEGTLYALSANTYQSIDLNSEEELNSFIFEELPSTSNLNIENGIAYFTSGTSVYQMSLNATEEPSEAILTYNSDSDYGVMYGFAVENDRIYIADGGDFSSDSFVEIYSLNGSLLKNITVGLGPNGFYFN